MSVITDPLLDGKFAPDHICPYCIYNYSFLEIGFRWSVTGSMDLEIMSLGVDIISLAVTMLFWLLVLFLKVDF